MFQNILGMNWYVAKLVYQVICGEGNHTPQFDEQLRLIRADQLEWAWEKAQVLGRMGQCIFQNCNEQNVQWKFIDVIDVVPISSMEDGAEVYSETSEPADAEEYIALIHARAERFYGNIDLKLKIGR